MPPSTTRGYRAIGYVGRHESLIAQLVAGSVAHCRDLVDRRRILPRSNAQAETARF